MVERALAQYFTVAERRITLRLMAYWEKKRGENAMPAPHDIDPEDIGDLWDHCFMVEVAKKKKAGYRYTYLGAAIRRAWLGGAVEHDEEGLPRSFDAATFGEHFESIIETGKPIVHEGHFSNLREEIVHYRQCILPLGENGQVAAIFGGIKFKILPVKS